MPVEKIAILGGGVAAVVAAYELTNVPEWQNQYEITLYQVGWRLGGKCASGRNRERNDRIEEHGLHILCGFYENAFHAIRGCYAELAQRGLRQTGAPNARWDEAFAPKDNVDLCEYVDGKWLPWTLIREPNGRVPGDYGEGACPDKPWQWVQRLISHILKLYGDSPYACEECDAPLHDVPARYPDLWRQISQRLEQAAVNYAYATAFDVVEIADKFAFSLSDDVGQHMDTDHEHILWLLDHFIEWLHRRIANKIESDTDLRRLVIEIGLCYATIRGIVRDGVLEKGASAIDDFDYKDWLGRQLGDWPGDRNLILLSAIVRGTYDLVFGFLHGEAWSPDNDGQWCLAAGTGLNFMMRLLFDYSGSIYYRMMGGTGDVILAPFYQVLKDRGVRFEFFHRVRNLQLAPDNANLIGGIEMGRQVRLKSGVYEPLYDVKGLPCWPSEPLYEQIDAEQARLLQKNAVDLESPWTNWDGEETVLLQAGRDFDRIVFGISIGAVPYVCAELVAANAQWQQMVQNVQSVKTMGVQFWIKPTLAELGWGAAPAMLDAFREPLNSWADHADLLPLENWPQENAPGDFAILCGPMRDDPLSAPPFSDPPFSDHQFPARQKEIVRTKAVRWLNEYSRDLWPNASPNGVFDWNILVDAQERVGEERLDAQYWKANINPSERYVLSPPSSTRSRLAPHASGFGNLIVTGDWTLNSINAGCVEATATSGMLAARAICGFPRFIFGED